MIAFPQEKISHYTTASAPAEIFVGRGAKPKKGLAPPCTWRKGSKKIAKWSPHEEKGPP